MITAVEDGRLLFELDAPGTGGDNEDVHRRLRDNLDLLEESGVGVVAVRVVNAAHS